MASPATQYGEEYEPRKTRKKVEASRATQVPGFFSSKVLRAMQRNQTLVARRRCYHAFVIQISSSLNPEFTSSILQVSYRKLCDSSDFRFSRTPGSRRQSRDAEFVMNTDDKTFAIWRVAAKVETGLLNLTAC